MGTEHFNELNAAAEALGDLRAFAAYERKEPKPEPDSYPTWKRLERDFRAALKFDPRRTVDTPAWEQKRARAFDVVGDSFAGTRGDESLAQLLWIVGAASRGEDVQAVSEAWIRAAALDYANWHLDDAMAAEAEQ